MRAKHFLELYEAQQELTEVEMSPSNLKKLVKNIDARVGMEFEMYVPNVTSDDDDDDDAREAYDQYVEDFDIEDEMRHDESTIDIDDIVSFFSRNNANFTSTINRLRNGLTAKYEQWAHKKIKEHWENDCKEYLFEYIKDNINDEVIADYLDMPEDLFGNRVPTSREFRELADLEYEKKGDIYNEAESQYYHDFDKDGNDIGEDDFLSEFGLDNMSDVLESAHSNGLGLNWPYQTSPMDFDDWMDTIGIERNSRSSDKSSMEDIAIDFMHALGYETVAYSTSYHGRYFKYNKSDNSWSDVGSKKPKDCYSIEPDGSLTRNDSDETGLEFVSPPLPLEQMTSDIKNIKKWADSIGARTDKSTGLHTNISVPNYDIYKLDYVKLALLSGDEHILREFDRLGNTYANSAIETIKSKIRNLDDNEIEELIAKLKNNVEEIASRVIRSQYTYSKFTSINTGGQYGASQKPGYVEFRSPGNDWLNEKYSKIDNTIMRYVVALDAACDPNKYRKEYVKALYKMVKPKSEKDNMSLFAQYMAGMITRSSLAGQLRKKKESRKENDKLASIISGEDDVQGILNDPGEQIYRFSTYDGSVAPAYARGVDANRAFSVLSSRNHIWRSIPLSNIRVEETSEAPMEPVAIPDDDSVNQNQEHNTSRYVVYSINYDNNRQHKYIAARSPDEALRIFTLITPTVTAGDVNGSPEIVHNVLPDFLNRLIRDQNSSIAHLSNRRIPAPPTTSETQYRVENRDTGESLTIYAANQMDAMRRVRDNIAPWQQAALYATPINRRPAPPTTSETQYRVENRDTGESLTIYAANQMDAMRRVRDNIAPWQQAALYATPINMNQGDI